MVDKLLGMATSAAGNILLALLIYIVGRIVISRIVASLKKVKKITELDPTISAFAISVVKWALYMFMIVGIINVLGVDTSSIIAVIASCGVAVGLALQGALTNLAGGIMLLIFRPFNVGDYVNAGGEEGTVKAIKLFYTVITTVDNKAITIPNGGLMNANVINFSSEKLRRVDLTFNISGAESIEHVREVILGVVAENELVLQDPAPFVSPVAGVPAGLTYTVRLWCESANYWDVYFSALQAIATKLGEEGIGGPVPANKVFLDK
ncbi:MAG: mechanosensitive ion channel [Erysipelotrichaceae bacterium]|nr:mechanosensitive ion channel [Erysipelotrichaceae bacterium]